MDKCNYITDKNGVTKEVEDLGAKARIDAIEQMLGMQAAGDTVQVNVTMTDNEDTSLAAVKVYITVDSNEEQEMTACIVNHVKMFSIPVNAGNTFRIRVSSIAGYITPDVTSYLNITKTTGLTVITLSYIRPMDGYIIINQSTANNGDIKIEDDAGGNIYTNNYVRPAVIDYIRKNSHRYVGTFDSASNKMFLKQIDDNDYRYYASDHSECLQDISAEGKDVFMKMPAFWTRATDLDNNGDRWKIEFHVGTDPGEGWISWGGNDLIGVYNGALASGGMHSLSGKNPSAYTTTNYVTQHKNATAARGQYFSGLKLRHHNIMAILFFAYYGTYNMQFTLCGYTQGAVTPTGSTNTLCMHDSRPGIKTDSNFWGIEGWINSSPNLLEDVEATISNGVVTLKVIEGESERIVYDDVSSNNTAVCPKKLKIGNYLDITLCNGEFITSSNRSQYYGTIFSPTGNVHGGVDVFSSSSLFYSITPLISGNNGMRSRLCYKGPVEIIQ